MSSVARETTVRSGGDEMSARPKLIYGGTLVRRWGRSEEIVENGALCEQDGRITAVGTYGEIEQRYPNAERIGDPSYIVVPGFVNAHSHGRGITTFQMGFSDQPLEPRILQIAAPRGDEANSARNPIDPYFDTLYSCLKQIASGITTTMHSSSYVEGSVDRFDGETRRFLEAYRDSGIRCAYALGIRDRSTVPFYDDKEFIASLPPNIRNTRELAELGVQMSFAQYERLFRELCKDYPAAKLQLGPWNPAFCSDELMEAVSDASKANGWRIHTHLAETRYQAQWARNRYGASWARRLSDIGVLSERFSGAHCVWLDGEDIAAMKRSGAQVVHNPGSNLRLQSGIAPLRDFLGADVPVAFGIDSLGMNDEEDIFQDLRLARLIHGRPRADSRLIRATTLLDMATRAGAIVAGIEGIGSLDEGNRADAVLLSRAEIEVAPSGHPLAELILMRAKAAHVKTVIVGGEILLNEGRWARFQPGEILSKALEHFGRTGRPAEDRSGLRDVLMAYLVGQSDRLS
jgi:5-methylthioadenosine/S-adenosylhomocysteine deaminase